MTRDSEDLNNRLQREFTQRDSGRRGRSTESSGSTGAEHLPVKAEVVATPVERASVPAGSDISEEQLGLINRMRLRNAESAHQLEKARLAYRTEMQLIQHQAEAAIRESKAFWDAKSVEVAESIKTYVQSTIRALEIDRLDSRNADLQRAYEAATAAMERARASSMPEVMKDRLIQNILDNFESTLERIQNDTIVARYDLD
ncbi:MAG: hypothetical protein KDA91_03795 [Planctomycetaceae bacterium]|nr:hypothetical protein [Planctomycetaceae bacterium]